MEFFKFWSMAFEYGWATIEDLRGAVKTESRSKGEITPEQFKEITKEDFIKVEKPVEVPAATNTTTETQSTPIVNP